MQVSMHTTIRAIAIPYSQWEVLLPAEVGLNTITVARDRVCFHHCERWWPKYLLPNMNDAATSDVRSAQGGSR